MASPDEYHDQHHEKGCDQHDDHNGCPVSVSYLVLVLESSCDGYAKDHEDPVDVRNIDLTEKLP